MAPAIQAAGLRALAGGATLEKTIALVKDFRGGDNADTDHSDGPFQPDLYLRRRKILRFDTRKAAGVDGLIVVDCPPEEDDELCKPALKAGLNFIRLATPTTDDKRLPKVLQNTSGFVYHVSIAGITGAATPDFNKVEAAVARIKNHTSLPIAVGFGVKTASDAANIAKGADGVVVGSALVEAVRHSLACRWTRHRAYSRRSDVDCRRYRQRRAFGEEVISSTLRRTHGSDQLDFKMSCGPRSARS